MHSTKHVQTQTLYRLSLHIVHVVHSEPDCMHALHIELKNAEIPLILELPGGFSFSVHVLSS